MVGALQTVYIPYRSLIEALFALNSPPVVSFNVGMSVYCWPLSSTSEAASGNRNPLLRL